MNDTTTRSRRARAYGGAGNAVYGLGLIGALVWYAGEADSLGSGVLGVLKAIVWPAFVVHDLLRFLAG